MTGKSAAQSAKEKLAGLAARRSDPDSSVAAEPSAAAARPTPAAPAPRTKPIRLSVDWLPADHRELTRNCDELAETLGRVSIPTAVLCRAAVQMVIRDADLRERLRDELAVDRGRL